MTDPTTVPATPRTKAGQEFQKWFGIGEAWTNIIPMILAIEDEAADTPKADPWQVRADDDDETLWTLAATPQADPAERPSPYRDLNEHIAQSVAGEHLFDEGCYFCRADIALAATEPDGLDALFDSIIDEYELAVGETFDRAHVKARWYARLRESGDGTKPVPGD